MRLPRFVLALALLVLAAAAPLTALSLSGCRADGQGPSAIDTARAANAELDRTAEQLRQIAADPAQPQAARDNAAKAADEIAQTKQLREAALRALEAWQNADPGSTIGDKLVASGMAIAPATGPAAPWITLGLPLVGLAATAIEREIRRRQAADAAEQATAKLLTMTAGAQAIIDANPNIQPPPASAAFAPEAVHVLNVLQGTVIDPELDRLTPQVP